MNFNIQPRYSQYKSLNPLVRCERAPLNQLPPIGSVLPEFRKQHLQEISPQKLNYIQSPPDKPIFRRIIANAANYNATIAAQSRNNISIYQNHIQRQLQQQNIINYSTHDKLKEHANSKPFYPRRKRLTPQQLQILNYVFNQNRFPSIEERLYLSERLWISARSIQIWFQNKRQIVKNNTHEY